RPVDVEEGAAAPLRTLMRQLSALHDEADEFIAFAQPPPCLLAIESHVSEHPHDRSRPHVEGSIERLNSLEYLFAAEVRILEHGVLNPMLVHERALLQPAVGQRLRVELCSRIRSSER